MFMTFAIFIVNVEQGTRTSDFRPPSVRQQHKLLPVIATR